MSIRFQADNDLKGLIVTATLRREPAIDFRSALAAGLDKLDDAAVLMRAARDDRILITHDKRTMPRYFTASFHLGTIVPESSW